MEEERPGNDAARASPPLDEWGIVRHSEVDGGAEQRPGGEAAEVDSLVSKFMGGRICSEVRAEGPLVY